MDSAFHLPPGFDESCELVVTDAERLGIRIERIEACNPQEIGVFTLDARHNIEEDEPLTGLNSETDYVCRFVLLNNHLYPRRCFRM